MPSIAHLMFGGIFGLLLYYITNGRFTKKHVFVLFVNNYLGPDLGWALGIGNFTHTFLGFTLFAFILTPIFSYFTRFTPDFRQLVLKDQGYSQTGYFATLCLIIAGGIMHNYLDGIMNFGGNFLLMPGGTGIFNSQMVSIAQLQQLWADPKSSVNVVISVAIGVLLIIGFIYLFVFAIRHAERAALGIIVVYLALFMVVFYYLGKIMTGSHADAGAILYVGLCGVLPLGLCTLSVKIGEKYPQKQPPTVPHMDENAGKFRLKFILGWLILSGLGGLGITFVLSLFADRIIALVFAYFGDDLAAYTTPSEALGLLLPIGIVFGFLGAINLILGIGLLARNKKLWHVAVIYHALLAITIIGLIFACILCEQSVIQLIPDKNQNEAKKA